MAYKTRNIGTTGALLAKEMKGNKKNFFMGIRDTDPGAVSH